MYGVYDYIDSQNHPNVYREIWVWVKTGLSWLTTEDEQNGLLRRSNISWFGDLGFDPFPYVSSMECLGDGDLSSFISRKKTLGVRFPAQPRRRSDGAAPEASSAERCIFWHLGEVF